MILVIYVLYTYIQQYYTFRSLFCWQKFCIQSNSEKYAIYLKINYEINYVRAFDKTHDCGTHPTAKPTRPLNRSNQPKLGATELNRPYKNSSTPHNDRAGLRPYRSLNWPQNVELNIMPKNTTVVVNAC